MEVLSIDMELNVGFFVEFVHIEVLNTDTYIIITILKSKLKRKKKRLSSHENKKEEKRNEGSLPASRAFSAWNL